ncbi:MAG: DUF3800 domain-containing protein [Candidatus Binataceae bacterium]
MLRAYIDDSGNGSPPMFVLAGWVSTDQFWRTFPEQWQQALGSLPSIQYFKMHEAHRLEGQFLGWDKNVRDAKIDGLLSVIKKHAMFGVHCAIPYAPYQALVTDKLARQLNRPYVLGFYFIMMELIGFLHLNRLPGPIEFVFDEQGVDAIYAQSAYDAFVRFAPSELRSLIGSRPIHRTDFDLLPLQAADLLAWQTRRYYWLRESNQEYNDWIWRHLHERFGIVQFEITEQRLRSFLKGAHELNRAEGRRFPYQIFPPPKRRRNPRP